MHSKVAQICPPANIYVELVPVLTYSSFAYFSFAYFRPKMWGFAYSYFGHQSDVYQSDIL